MGSLESKHHRSNNRPSKILRNRDCYPDQPTATATASVAYDARRNHVNLPEIYGYEYESADRKRRAWDNNHNHQPLLANADEMASRDVTSQANASHSPWAAACLGNVVTCGSDVLYELDVAASKVYKPLRTEAVILGSDDKNNVNNNNQCRSWSGEITNDVIATQSDFNSRFWDRRDLRIAAVEKDDKIVSHLFNKFPQTEVYDDDRDYEPIITLNDSYDEGYDNDDEGIYDTLEPQSCPTCNGVYCNYTCHLRCHPLVSLDCTNQTIPLKEQPDSCLQTFSEEENTEEGEEVIIEEEIANPLTNSWTTGADLRRQIDQYNASVVGGDLTLSEDGETFSGFVRVHMKLCRPINVVSGTRPPSIYDVLYDDGTGSMEKKTLTSFYLPRDTVKAIHITSMTTTQEVISSLLRKFQVVDNPHKFALYERYYEIGESTRVRMRRIQDSEQPLKLVLMWHCQGLPGKQLVLQENDTGDIPWDAFTLPELSNFLRMLEREEDEYLNQVRLKYRIFSEKLLEAINYQPAEEGKDVTTNDSPHRRHSDTSCAHLREKRPNIPPAVPVRSDSLPNRDGGRRRVPFPLRLTSGTAHLASSSMESGFHTQSDRAQSDYDDGTVRFHSGDTQPVGFLDGLRSSDVGLLVSSDQSGLVGRPSATGGVFSSFAPVVLRQDASGRMNGYGESVSVKGTGKFPHS